MTQPNEDLVRAASAAFGRGDLATLQDQFFADNIVWHVAGTGPLAGDYAGAAQVVEQLSKVSKLAGGSVRPELHDVLVSPDHTVVLVTIHAERAGKQAQLISTATSSLGCCWGDNAGTTLSFEGPI